MTVSSLPALNALLNFISAILLIIGRVQIRQDKMEKHRLFMLAALVTSALFLISYTIYHSKVGSVPYPKYDWTRPLYFGILIPHVILAGLMVPFIIAALWLALRGRFEIHRKLTVWVWPAWIFVSVSGIIVYLMLYQF